MLENSQALTQWITVAGLGIGLLGGFAKLVSILQRGGNGEARKSDQESFRLRLDDLKSEILRLRDEVAFERAKKEEYRTANHDLRNEVLVWMDRVQILQIELDTERLAHGKPPFEPPDENGGAR